MYYVIHVPSDMSSPVYFLCQDGKLRECPTFGTYSFCIKGYKSRGFALKAMRKLRKGGYRYAVMYIDNGIEMNGVGIEYNDKFIPFRYIYQQSLNGIQECESSVSFFTI